MSKVIKSYTYADLLILIFRHLVVTKKKLKLFYNNFLLTTEI